MIIAFAPSPLRFAPGTIMDGRTGNSVRPDFLLGCNITPTMLLNKYIGDNLPLPNGGFYKVYETNSSVLHEYTLFRVTLVNNEIFYIPVSLKRYYSDGDFVKQTYTYLYIKGITTILKPNDYNIVSLYQLLELVRPGKNNILNNSGIPYDAASISLEHPEVMTSILEEISQNGLSDPVDTNECINRSLYTIQDDITLINKVPDDDISVYGCTYSPMVPEAKLMQRQNLGQCLIYSQLAEEQIRNMQNADLLPLDLSAPCFNEFEFERIISDIYCSPYTDIYLDLDESGSIINAYFSLLSCQDEVVRAGYQFMIPRIVSNGIRVHNRTHVIPISRISLSKNWLDELYFTIYYKDGGYQCYFMNLSAYHLYSPSIIRIHPIY